MFRGSRIPLNTAVGVARPSLPAASPARGYPSKERYPPVTERSSSCYPRAADDGQGLPTGVTKHKAPEALFAPAEVA